MKKQAMILAVVWSTVAVVFFWIVASGGGIDSFDNNSARVALTAFIYGVAIFITMAFGIGNRKRRRRGVVVRDELDDEIEKKASGAALIVVMIFIYALGIVLWEVYRETEAIPVGWAYVMAYSSVTVGSLAHAVSRLLIHRELYGDA